MNTINTFNEVFVVVDQDQRFKDAQNQGKKIDPEREAETITTLVKVLGRRSVRYALVSEHDDRGLKAFHKNGFEVIPVNGNRNSEVSRFINQHSDSLKMGRVNHLVLITSDPTFAFLARQADPKTTQVSVWAPANSVDHEMTLPPYEYRNLDEMLPGSPKVVILIDFENIWYGMKKLGGVPEPKALIEKIKSIGDEFGEIKKLTAYADWEPMNRERNGNIQRELVQLDVETQYLINMRGKNTADMRVANDIRDLIEKGNGMRDEVDIIILATGDRDFRDIVKTAKDRGKRVVILAVHNGVSQDLINVASEVRYIDDYLNAAPKAHSGKTTIRPWDEYNLEIAKIVADGKTWLPISELANFGVANSDEFAKRTSERRITKLENRMKSDGSDESGIRLNMENLQVKAVALMARWVPDRIAYSLTKKGMPYIDAGYIAKGMTMDKTFQEWGIGQERSEAEKWLELLSRAKVIEKKVQSHPVSVDRQITTWWLPNKAKVAQSVTSSPEVAQNQLKESQLWPTSVPTQSQQAKNSNSGNTERPSSLWQSVLGSPA